MTAATKRLLRNIAVAPVVLLVRFPLMAFARSVRWVADQLDPILPAFETETSWRNK